MWVVRLDSRGRLVIGGAREGIVQEGAKGGAEEVAMVSRWLFKLGFGQLGYFSCAFLSNSKPIDL